MVQDLAQQTKYPFSGAVAVDAVTHFMRKYIKGEIPASIKSAPVPASQGPVYTLVADDWDTLFGDADKDVFAEFYAPWCGHCREWADGIRDRAKRRTTCPDLGLAR